MNVTTRRAAVSLLAVGLFAISSTALATNGYFTHGVGAQSKGMAGAGVGSNADMGAIMSASNPALGVFADDRWEAGLSIFSPRRSYEASQSAFDGGMMEVAPGVFLPSFSIAPGKVDSSSEYFPIPYVAKNWSLQNDANITMNFYGRGGMNTDWDSNSASVTSYFCGATESGGPATGQGPYCGSSYHPAGDGTAGVNLMQAFLALNYSAKVNDNFAWGAGPVIAVQMFEAKGIWAFAPISKTFASSGGQAFPSTLTNNDADTSFGFGFGAGLWWGISDTVSLGLAYQSKMSMGEFDDYAELFAESGDFDIPSSIKAGLSFVATEQLRVNFDIEHTAYGEVDSIANPMINMLGCSSPALPFGGTDLESCLGGARGPGFGWDDMTTYKLGFEWAQDDSTTWRFGYSYGEQPIQKDDMLFNILAPGVMEQHITFGLTKKAANGSVWAFSFMYAPENDVVGPNLFDPSQTITLTMEQLEFELAYRF